MNPTEPHQLVDRYHRRVDYLRLSVTDRCNLRCRYCAPAMPDPMDIRKLLAFPEMLRLVKIAAGLGITKVRLTGGEPLCRQGVAGFIEDLSHLTVLNDISITTNGTLLPRKARQLRSAGLGRINISLDTLDRLKYHRLTGADGFRQVWQGIMLAAELGFDPLKINVVVMKGFNDDELEAMARLTFRYPFHIRFIEYMPIGTDPMQSRDCFLPADTIRERLIRTAPLVPVASSTGGGPARRYRFPGAPGEIGLISAMSDHFCSTCNRLRLTADGRLRPCLLSEETLDVRSLLRDGASDDALAGRFRQALLQKGERHHMTFTRDRMLQTRMVSIGG